jgi:hypothetical protein
MISKHLLAAAGAAALALAAASPSFAMSGECLWRHLEPATRDAFLREYGRLGPAVLDRVAISDREYAAMDEACGGSGADPALKDRLLGSTVIEHGSAVYLQGRLGWDNQAIQAAWARLSPELLDRLHAEARQALRSRTSPSDELDRAARRLLGSNPPTDPAVLDQARAYVTSRVMRETVELSSPVRDAGGDEPDAGAPG